MGKSSLAPTLSSLALPLEESLEERRGRAGVDRENSDTVCLCCSSNYGDYDEDVR